MSEMCDKCPLDGCPRITGGWGKPESEIIIVGEAPGAQEIRQDKPFVGRSGTLVDKLLDDAGLHRSQCYITNATLCWPQPHRAPKMNEMNCCLPRLREEILRCENRKVILCLGAASSKLLAGISGIVKDRGVVVPAEDNEFGVPIICTYHPAALLRNIKLYAETLGDYQKVARILQGEQIITTKDVRTIVIDDVTTLAGVQRFDAFLQRLETVDAKVAIDIETCSDGSLYCVGFAWRGEGAVVLTRKACYEHHVIQGLSRVLPRKQLIAHHAPTEMKGLWAAGYSEDITIHTDTMIQSYMLNETLYKETDRRGTNGLKYLAREYLGIPNWQGPVKKYISHLEDHPDPQIVYEYNARDCAYTWLLDQVLEPMLKEKDSHIINTILRPVAPVLARMELLGVRCDREFLAALDVKQTALVEELERDLWFLAGKEFNPKSHPQTNDVFYKHLGLTIPGGLTTEAKALAKIIDEHPIVQALLDFRREDKFLSTYIRGILAGLDENDRCHGEFNTATTVSGRLSSSNPNLQNITAKDDGTARNIFMATPGWILLDGDLSQAEVRVLAMVSGDKALRDACTQADMHTRTATIMFGIQPEDVSAKMRQAAKRLTFGTIYQMSVLSLALELGTSLQEAEELVARFFKAFPDAVAWIEDIKQFALQHGFVESWFGRQRRFPAITEFNQAEILRQAVNFPIQSAASDITLLALIRIAALIRKGEMDKTRLLMTVHDSIVAETEKDWEDAVWMAWLMKQEMEKPAMNDFVPMRCDVKWGHSWGSLEKIDWNDWPW